MNCLKYHRRKVEKEYREKVEQAIKAEIEKVDAMTEEERKAYFAEQAEKQKKSKEVLSTAAVVQSMAKTKYD